MKTFFCISVLAAALLFFVLPSASRAEWDIPKADMVVIIKGKKQMLLIKDSEVMVSYKVSLGGDPNGKKLRQGDKKTPEGLYFIKGRNQKSKYHLALHISYPNGSDMERARTLGLKPGGDIMIHGLSEELSWLGRFHSVLDWTDGCIAVTNEEMEELWQLVPDGTPVEIIP